MYTLINLTQSTSINTIIPPLLIRLLTKTKTNQKNKSIPLQTLSKNKVKYDS